ncbi:MAG TPA: metalloregulator ArsR/SmtB family transcription factor [Myxococcota bacterium]|nr:metalloregulator ArsR/SmtB family transcription factor [Myxococcota bacterium]HRY92477.1 metalloregulator ArsR/SmtB family transcription factor [Myxococcota bacterium]
MKDVARFFKALSDGARLEMLWLLLNHRELCVCDLMGALGITQSKASRHLAVLRHAGLVVDRREATWSYYSLRPVESGLERSLLDALRGELASHPGAARVLRELEGWLARKERAGACAAGRAGRAAIKKKPAGRSRSPRAGGAR